MTFELEGLQKAYDHVCQRIEATAHAYTFSIERRDDGSPHVEYSGGEFHYVVTERGLELDRRSTADPDEILYWMIRDLTFWMGAAYEFKHRIEGQDARRIIFAHWLELMMRADPQMARRLRLHIDGILDRHPFIDPAAR